MTAKRFCLRLAIVGVGLLLVLLAIPWVSIWITHPELPDVVWIPALQSQKH